MLILSSCFYRHLHRSLQIGDSIFRVGFLRNLLGQCEGCRRRVRTKPSPLMLFSTIFAIVSFRNSLLNLGSAVSSAIYCCIEALAVGCNSLKSFNPFVPWPMIELIWSWSKEGADSTPQPTPCWPMPRATFFTHLVSYSKRPSVFSLPLSTEDLPPSSGSPLFLHCSAQERRMWLSYQDPASHFHRGVIGQSCTHSLRSKNHC